MKRIIYCILGLITATASAADIHEAARNGETQEVQQIITDNPQL